MQKDRSSIGEIFLGVIDESTSPIALIGEDRRMIFCNRAWKRFHGVDEDTDCSGNNVYEAMKNEKVLGVMKEGRASWAKGDIFRTQFFADWTGQWIQVIANRLAWLSDPMIVVMLIDITETVRAHEVRVKSLFKALPAPTFVWKKEGGDIILRDYNDAAVEMTQGRVQEALGITAAEMYSDNPRVLADLRKCLEEKVTIENETEYRSRYADWTKWFAVKYAFVEPDTVMVHTEDITERVMSVRELERYKNDLEALVKQRTSELIGANEQLKAEIDERERTGRALAMSEERYRAVSEITSDYTYSGIVYPDLTMKREWVAGAFTNITGYRLDEIDGVFGHFDIVHPRDRRKAEKQRKAFLSGKRSESEFRIVTKSGEVRWILTHGLPGQAAGDGGMRVIGAVKDITERKQFEIELENRNRELRSLNLIGEIFDKAGCMAEALESVMDLLVRESDIKTAGVWLMSDSGESHCLAARNMPEAQLEPLKTLKADDEYAIAIGARDRACVVERIFQNDDGPRERLKKETGVARVVALPVKTAGRPRAIFVFGFPTEDEIDNARLDYFDVVGSQIGLGIEKLDLIEEREKQEVKLRRLTWQLLESAPNERAAISHELHDVIGQDLINIRNYIQMIDKMLGPTEGEIRNLLEAITCNVQELTAKTRDFAYSLHPPVLGDIGLGSAIEEYIEKAVRPEGFEVELIVTGFDEELPESLERSLYMIAQEALTNIIRHSGAKYVVVRMIKGYPDVIMDIRDDGRGFSLSSENTMEGLGITGMRERVQNLGGRFKIATSPGEGTHLRIEIPLEVKDE